MGSRRPSAVARDRALLMLRNNHETEYAALYDQELAAIHEES